MNYIGLQKGKFGKQILLKSPSMFLDILNRKLSYQDLSLIKINTWTVKASQYNPYDNTYKKKSLSNRWHQWNKDIKIQRDIFSAWLIKNVDDSLEKVDRQKCLDEFKQFYSNYLIEENRLRQCNNLISSMGF
jgi:5,10-methylene-tetrahydrofolate dehydrogenase/methenyl tetrahydrofolate cyclohydrolase